MIPPVVLDLSQFLEFSIESPLILVRVSLLFGGFVAEVALLGAGLELILLQHGVLEHFLLDEVAEFHGGHLQNLQTLLHLRRDRLLQREVL